jgi:hypothetical protein
LPCANGPGVSVSALLRLAVPRSCPTVAVLIFFVCSASP